MTASRGRMARKFAAFHRARDEEGAAAGLPTSALRDGPDAEPIGIALDRRAAFGRRRTRRERLPVLLDGGEIDRQDCAREIAGRAAEMCANGVHPGA